MNSLIASGTLTPDGKAWLTNALDPFHDFELQLAGVPDRDPSRTIVSKIKRTCTIDASGLSIPPGQTWEAHCFLLPFMSAQADGRATLRLGRRQTRSAYDALANVTGVVGAQTSADVLTHPYALANADPESVMDFGIFNIVKNLTNVISVPDGQNGFPNQGVQVDIGIPASASTGRRRIASIGFEIRDVTPALYKQGTATTYCVPNTWSQRQYAGGALNRSTSAGSGYSLLVTSNAGYLGCNVNGDFGPATFDALSLPPPTSSAALTYSGSRQWKAEDGVYMVGRLHANNPLREDQSGFICLCAGDRSAYPVDNVGSYGDVPIHDSAYLPNVNTTYGTSVVPENGYSCFPHRGERYAKCEFDTSGVFLTGLGANSTFTVTLFITFEYSPDVSDSTNAALVPLATPSPMYDGGALELYQRAFTQLPVAVPVSMNASGDYWAMAMNAVKSAASTVGRVVGSAARFAAPLLESSSDPRLQALGVVSGMAGSALRPKRSDGYGSHVVAAQARQMQARSSSVRSQSSGKKQRKRSSSKPRR